MKQVYINPLELIATAFSAGLVTVDEINEAINSQRGLNMPCGFAYNEHNQSYGIFFHTDKETRQPKKTDKGHLALNVRAQQKNQKKQEAQTPGAVLPQGQQGVPQLTPETLAALQQVLAAAQGGQPVAQPQIGAPESDFGDVSGELKL